MGPDTFRFRIKENKKIINIKSGKSLDLASYKKIERDLIPLYDPDSFVVSEKTIKGGQNAVRSFQAGFIVLKCFKNGAMQELWGMLNTQAITNHLAMGKIPLEQNCNNYMAFMGEMNQKDVFPSDEFWDYLFEYTSYPTESSKYQ